MKFTCTKENLLHALDVVGGAGGKQSNLPILANTLITVTESKVECTGTNLEIAIRSTVRAKIDVPGSFTVPTKTFADYIRLLGNDQVDVELSGAELHISSGSSSTKIKGAPADEYPVIPDIEETHGYTIVTEPLKEALSKTVVAVAKNEIRPELSGVLFQFFSDRYAGLLLAATDSYRLAEKRVSVAQGRDQTQCIVPSRTVFEMIRLLSLSHSPDAESQVRLFVSDNQIAIRYDTFEMSSRLIDGKYPDYAQIIPSSFKTVAAFPREEMVKNIKAASLFATTGVNAVLFDGKSADRTVGVSSVSSQTGEHASRVDADIVGDDASILLNFRYVLDGLQHMEESDEAELCVNSGDAPCMFRAKNDDSYLYIVMPVRQ